MPIPLGSGPGRLFAKACALANDAPGRTLIRKTSLLRIVPTACGQAADMLHCANSHWFSNAYWRANSQWRSNPVARRFSSPRNAIAFNARRLRIARDLRRERLSERSYLFTMSDITRPQEARRLHDGRGRRSLRTSHPPRSGGARRDRTDDLLLAKQALSQLSYGPGPSAGTAPETPMRIEWWAWEDLNFRPHAYQARALTN
jgi:hypothetical protein